ncbi:MAG TPA: fluoride efflux transporter CrcB [Bacteroidia bacterium]|nr:fluoride efflux transporter CrcB [Bacteroidia bacterium]HNU32704.1 fluoride efflux transporter CrcB [Bacteroidia bacterium]
MNYILIFLGGGLGSLSRYTIGLISEKYLPGNFPYSTLLSNAISSFILGILISYLLLKFEKEQLRAFIAIGFCGGFSTFSTFTYETFELLKTCNYIIAGANVFLNLAVCMFLFAVGYKLI